MAGKDVSLTQDVHRQVWMTLKDVSISNVINYLTSQTNLEHRLEGSTVIFAPPKLKAGL